MLDDAHGRAGAGNRSGSAAPAASHLLDRAGWIVPAASGALAAALCLFHLTGRSIWNDEAVAVRIAQTPGWEPLMSDGGNMALYYLFLRFWLGLGDSLALVRLPSAIFAAAAVVLTWVLARRLYNPRVAAVASLLLALNSSLVYYGQEARSYTLVLLLTVAGWLALAVALERRTARWFLLWGGLGALAVAAQLFSLLVIGAQLAGLALLGIRRVPVKGLLAGLGVAAAGSAPILAAAAGRGTVQLDWIPPASAAGLRQVVWFLGGNNFEPGGGRPAALLGGAVLLVCLAGWPAGARHALRALRRHGPSPEAWRYGVPVAWLAVPLAGALAASAVQPLLVPRFFTPLLPAGTILLALAICRLKAAPFAAATAVLVLLGASGVARSYGTGDWGWDRAAGHLASAARPGDTVVVLPSYMRLSVDYHLRDTRRPPEFLSPREAAWRPPPPTVYGVLEAFYEPAPPALAAERAASRSRFWVVTSDFTRWDGDGRVVEAWGEAGDFFGALGPAWRVTSSRAEGRTGVLLVERRPEAGSPPAGGSSAGLPAE